MVSIPKILVDYLKTQKDGCMYVLHSSKGERMTEQGWKRMWESYMRDLNVKYGYDGQQNKNRPGGLPMAIETFTPHQLRHTFCTLMYLPVWTSSLPATRWATRTSASRWASTPPLIKIQEKEDQPPGRLPQKAT